MSEREYAAHAGLSRGAIQKAKAPAGSCYTPTARSMPPRATPGARPRPTRSRRGSGYLGELRLRHDLFMRGGSRDEIGGLKPFEYSRFAL